MCVNLHALYVIKYMKDIRGQLGSIFSLTYLSSGLEVGSRGTSLPAWRLFQVEDLLLMISGKITYALPCMKNLIDFLSSES